MTTSQDWWPADYGHYGGREGQQREARCPQEECPHHATSFNLTLPEPLAARAEAETTPATTAAQVAGGQPDPPALPRTADGKPDLQGIWQVRNRAAVDLRDHAARFGMPAGESVVDGSQIPYQPEAAAKKAENFANRQMADPLAKCYLPGVPRIMYRITVTDPLVYAKPWTLAYPLKKQSDELLEDACHEDNQDLPHLKAIKDAAARAGGAK